MIITKTQRVRLKLHDAFSTVPIGPDQIREGFQQGIAFLGGEFRDVSFEQSGWVDPDKNTRTEKDVLTVTLECGSRTVFVALYGEDGQLSANIDCPFNKGDKVVVVLDTYVYSKGKWTARGVLHPYTSAVRKA